MGFMGTQASYQLWKWVQYCQNINITNPSYATYEKAVTFFTYLFHKENCNYGVIAVSRSALSAILLLKEEKAFGECQKFSKMLKERFRLRPTFPKYTVIYDPYIILRYMDMLPNNSSLLLEELKKLCTLLCLLSKQRCQVIASLDLNISVDSSEKFTYTINKVMNTIKSGKH